MPSETSPAQSKQGDSRFQIPTWRSRSPAERRWVFQLLHDQPEREEASAADEVTENVLRLFGMSAEEAHEICPRPLPDLDSETRPDSAA